jgi:hypothetical protein
MTDAAGLGAIDDRGARVWFRLPIAGEVTATLRVEGRDPVTASTRVTADTDWTGVLTPRLAEPAPDMPFTVEVAGRTLAGRLAPSLGTHAGLTFGFGSCHMPFVDFAEDSDAIRVSDHARGLYPAMRNELLEARARLLLLTGDQIYADEEPGISVRDDLDGNSQHPPPLEQVLAAYRRNYHGFFNETGYRALLDTFPTVMMWDDHDIYDNWGSMRKRTPLDDRLFDAASRTFVEYQQGRNPENGGTTPPFTWTMAHGDIGFLALDLRGARDPASGTMLGTEQWERITSYLNGDESREVRTLFVVASVPIAHVSRWFTTVFDLFPERYVGSVKDRWTVRRFIASRDALLDALFAWESKRPERQVILLSGDVHSASAFTIRQRGGPGVIQQVTSSAFSTPFIRKQLFFNRLVVQAPNLLEPRYRFERHFLSLTHNYGIARVEPLPSGGHRVVITIRAWNERTRTLRTAGRIVTP